MSDTADLTKPLPSNDDAEKIILGTIFLDEKYILIAKDVLVPHDFYNPVHRRVFEALLDLHESGSAIDPIAVDEWWKVKHKNEEYVSMLSRVSQLINGLPYTKEDEYRRHCVTVKRHAVSRSLIFLANTVQRDILEGEEEIEEIAKNVELTLSRMNDKLLGVKSEQKPFLQLAQIKEPMLEQFERYNRGEFTGVRTGMKELDDKLDGGGFQGKATYLLGAGEKVGKTSLALRWALNVASEQNLRVPVITMEMAAVTLAKRLFSQHSGIPYWMFRPGFNGQMYQRAVEDIESFSQLPITIADSLYGMSQIKHFLRREVELGLKKNQPVGMAVIDYLQIIVLDILKAQSREREVATISRELKQLATELNIPLVIISNLNRLGLTEGQEPDTFNLRDSGSLAFDAEAVMFLHNPAYVPGKPYEPKDPTDINLIISRQRNGPVGRIKLKLIGKYMQFVTEAEYDKLIGNAQGQIDQIKTPGLLQLEAKKQEEAWDTPEEEDDDIGDF